MGLFKSSKKVSSKNADKAAPVAAPPPVEAAPVPEPEPQVVLEPTSSIDAFGYASSPLVQTVSDTSFIDYQPRPPPNGKGYVSPLSSWLEEYGTGPFLSRDGSKPQYPGGKDEKKDGDNEDVKEKGEKKPRDSSSGSKEDKEVERTQRNRSSPAKGKDSREPAESSEFTRVKRGSTRSRRDDEYDGERVRGARDGRREYSRGDGRYSSEREARTMSRTSDSSHVSDRSYGSDNSAEKAVKDKEAKKGSRSKNVPEHDDDEEVAVIEKEVVEVEGEDLVPEINDEFVDVVDVVDKEAAIDEAVEVVEKASADVPVKPEGPVDEDEVEGLKDVVEDSIKEAVADPEEPAEEAEVVVAKDVVKKWSKASAGKIAEPAEEAEVVVAKDAVKKWSKAAAGKSAEHAEEAEAPVAKTMKKTHKASKAAEPSDESEPTPAKTVVRKSSKAGTRAGRSYDDMESPGRRGSARKSGGRVAAPKPAKPFDEPESPLAKDVEEETARDDVEDVDLDKVKVHLDFDEELDGKKVRTLDNGSELSDSEKYTSEGRDLPDKDSEMGMLKDKLKQLQQKLAEERADKMELQKKLKDRDREIFSLNKQLDKVEAQLDRYERFGTGLEGGNGSRGSLVDQDGNPMSEREMRSADDLQLALRAFKEHSNAKLAETFKQNADLRHQVESYETLCRTIGEVLRDYEWLQQCRIVTGDLDYSRLRKAMMKLWHTGKTRAVLPVVAMVLAFGPDEVSRCRHVLNSAKQDADMVDYIPEIIEHNMDETMKRDSITVYIEAHKQLTEDTEIALYLTDRFAERYKGEWHCVVGEQYALSSCYESKVIKFKSGHRSVILWSN